jgi:hypothetical protein
MGLEGRRKRVGWTLAWKRPIQLSATMAKTRMALRIWQRMVGLPICPMGLRQIPMASKVVVGISTI